jgi:hypothetical protein
MLHSRVAVIAVIYSLQCRRLHPWNSNRTGEVAVQGSGIYGETGDRGQCRRVHEDLLGTLSMPATVVLGPAGGQQRRRCELNEHGERRCGDNSFRQARRCVLTSHTHALRVGDRVSLRRERAIQMGFRLCSPNRLQLVSSAAAVVRLNISNPSAARAPADWSRVKRARTKDEQLHERNLLLPRRSYFSVDFHSGAFSPDNQEPSGTSVSRGR